jgi:hypothetical protein
MIVKLQIISKVISKAGHFVSGALLLTTLLFVTSCSSKPSVSEGGQAPLPSPNMSTPADFGGEIVTDTITTNATVVSVNRPKRLVVLKWKDGRVVTCKVLLNAIGFDEVKSGDEVKVSLAEELAVFLGKNGLPPGTGTNTTKLRVRLPDGSLAAAAEVGTMVFTATIVALNDWNDTVTLRLPDGSTKTIKVSEFVNLAEVNVGDKVSVKFSESAVALLEKP